MNYTNITNVQLIPKGVRLTGPKKTDISLDRDNQGLYFFSEKRKRDFYVIGRVKRTVLDL
jgi:hypothetical protein